MPNYLILCTCAFLGSVLLRAQPAIRFDSTRYNVGLIPEDRELEVIIPFRNTGKEPLIIRRVVDRGGVGVAAAYGGTPAHPLQQGLSERELVVLPRKQGFIRYRYPPQGRIGPFEKSVVVYSNIPDSAGSPPRVIVRGEVIRPDRY